MSEQALVDRQMEEVHRKQEEQEAKIPPRVAGLDPGKQMDSFALVGIEIRDQKDIYIIGAAQWKHQDYLKVEDEAEQIHKSLAKRPFNDVVIETNNTGWHVVEILRKKGMPIRPVTTVAKLTDKKKIREGNNMPKNEMVTWFKKMILADRVFFPDKDSPGTKALKAQLPKFSRKLTEAGNISYSAQGKEHDDLVMALLLACYYARRRYIKDGSKMPEITSANYTKKSNKVTLKDQFPDLLKNPYIRMTGFSKYH